MSAPSSLRARLFAGTLLALTLAPAAARAEDTARDADEAALRWREGDPVPEGYRRRQPGVGAGIAAAGATVFGVAYVAMGALGGLGLLSWLAYRGDPSPTLPAFLPLAGPFVLASAIDSNPSFRAFLVVDGSLQIAGLAMAAVGAYVHVSSRAVLVRDRRNAPVPDREAPDARALPFHLHAAPAVGAGGGGLSVGGVF